MDMSLDRRALRVGGICGVLCVVCYLIAITVPLPDPVGFLVSMLFPIFGVVYSYGLYRGIARERNGLSNRLGVIFAVLAFAILAQMLAVQICVQLAFPQIKAGLTPDAAAALTPVKYLVRYVDLGLDLAWDMFMGVAMVLTGAAMYTQARFGKIWGGLSILISGALMGFNIASVPNPPGDSGSIDLGPVAALFIVALSIRLVLLSRTMPLVRQHREEPVAVS